MSPFPISARTQGPSAHHVSLGSQRGHHLLAHIRDRFGLRYRRIEPRQQPRKSSKIVKSFSSSCGLTPCCLPQNNTSLSGVLSTLSKLIICAVMIRGRHRGLPIAIDRAVLLPSDLEKHGDDTATRASADTGDTNLRMRPTRTSLSSMTAVAPQTGGGLETVEPLTDDARYARARQNSLGSHFNGSGHSHPVGGSESVRGIDHHLAPPPETLQESDISEKGLTASASSSSGAATTSLESKEDHKLTESPVDGQEHDRNKPGWK